MKLEDCLDRFEHHALTPISALVFLPRAAHQTALQCWDRFLFLWSNPVKWLACAIETSFSKDDCSWWCYCCCFILFCFYLSYAVEIPKLHMCLMLYHCSELPPKLFPWSCLERVDYPDLVHGRLLLFLAYCWIHCATFLHAFIWVYLCVIFTCSSTYMCCILTSN